MYYSDNRNLQNGVWINIQSEEQHKKVKRDSRDRVQAGRYEGPGRYLKLSYSQPCPRGCCYDGVTELLSADEARREINEVMEEFKDLLPPEPEPEEQEDEVEVRENHNWSEEGF